MPRQPRARMCTGHNNEMEKSTILMIVSNAESTATMQSPEGTHLDLRVQLHPSRASTSL